MWDSGRGQELTFLGTTSQTLSGCGIPKAHLVIPIIPTVQSAGYGYGVLRINHEGFGNEHVRGQGLAIPGGLPAQRSNNWR